jgi:hypothetical protein
VHPQAAGGAHGGAESLPCGWISFGRNVEYDNRRQPTLNGGGVGVPCWMQVRVWDLNQFATYEAALRWRHSSAFDDIPVHSTSEFAAGNN